MSLLKNLYTVKSYDSEKYEILFTTEEHPVFKAHFPGNPILPGFIQVDIAQEIFNLHFTSIKKIKFINIIFPNTSVIYQKNNNKITITNHQNQKISEFIYE